MLGVRLAIAVPERYGLAVTVHSDSVNVAQVRVSVRLPARDGQVALHVQG